MDENNPMHEYAELALLVIQPYVVTLGFGNEILDLLQRNRFLIMGERRVIVKSSVVKDIFSFRRGTQQEFFDAFEGALMYVQVSSKDSQKRLRKFAGDDDPEAARIGTLHYMYGVNRYYNGIFVPATDKEYSVLLEKLELYYRMFQQATLDRESGLSERVEKMFQDAVRPKAEESEEEKDEESLSCVLSPTEVDRVVDSYSGRTDYDSMPDGSLPSDGL